MKISIIIPTFNEQEYIGALIQYLNANRNQFVSEIIVVDAGSMDDTVKIVHESSAILIQSEKKGRASQMNLGAKVATGELLYFVHADVKIPATYTTDIINAVAKGASIGCYRYVFDIRYPLLRFNEFMIRFNGIMCRGGDQTLFVTKKLFADLNGFDEKFIIMEDYDFIKRARKLGIFNIIPKNAVVSARKYKTNSWFRIQFSNLTVFMMFFLNFSPVTMSNFYKKMIK